MSAVPMFLQEAGLPVGGPDFNPYVMLEVHYNNPRKLSGGAVTFFLFFVFFFILFFVISIVCLFFFFLFSDIVVSSDIYDCFF